MTPTKLPIVVLISGNGSNLQAIIDEIDRRMLDISIKAVISNKSSAYGLERAKKANIPTHVLLPKDFSSRAEFDQALRQLIDQYQPQLVVLAGFMRILSAEFVSHYVGRLINIHPSLLPKLKGLNTHARAIADGEKMHGCTVHFVNAEMDEGPIIAQMECEITADDTAETLQEKVHQLEHTLYPEVINCIAEGRVKL
jgi:phosphoribosylglycinamide formyltransferase-1